jgi:hypothetical protein
MSDGHGAAYGFRWSGLSSPALRLSGADDWPLLSVRHTRGSENGASPVDVDRASIQTLAARLRLDRASATVEIVSSHEVPVADLVHPTLWPAASVFARWRGRETLHAGAFTLDGEIAWAVLGERGAGKSSLLSALALRGIDVLCDDLLVIDGDRCFAGPRCIDLRPGAAAALGVAREAPVVRSTERRRLALEPCTSTYRLGGLVSLAWADSIDVSRLTPAESFGLLFNHRRVSALGADFPHLLELAGLPTLRFTRPRDWRALGAAIAELTDAAASAGASRIGAAFS